MPECVDCGCDYTLDDGCESDGWCHPCAHAVADSRNSAMVSARDLTIRELRAAGLLARHLLEQAADTLFLHAGAETTGTEKLRACAERLRTLVG